MAAANGQRHHQLLEAGAPAPEQAKAHKAVLEAVQRAVDLDPSFKRRLADLAKPTARDNDLQDFASDRGFRKIVG